MPASRHRPPGRNLRRNRRLRKSHAHRPSRRKTLRPLSPAQPLRSHARPRRSPHRLGLLPRPERINLRHAAKARSPDRTLRPRIPRLHSRPPHPLTSWIRKNGRQPDRRRHQRRRHEPAPTPLPPHPPPIRNLRPRYLSLLVIDSTRRRSPRHVRPPSRQASDQPIECMSDDEERSS